MYYMTVKSLNKLMLFFHITKFKYIYYFCKGVNIVTHKHLESYVSYYGISLI